MAEEKIELSAPVKELLDEVDALYPLGMVHVDFTGDKSGFVRHDQGLAAFIHFRVLQRLYRDLRPDARRVTHCNT